MRTVKELVKELKKFNEDMPIVYRQAQIDGGYIDYEMHTPADNYYPGGAVVLQSFQPYDDSPPSKAKP